MKTKAIIALTTALGMLMLAGAATAETIDKGSLGKYERRGQFLVPINAVKAPAAVAASSESPGVEPASKLDRSGAKVTPAHEHKGPHHPGGNHGTPRFLGSHTGANTQKAMKGGS